MKTKGKSILVLFIVFLFAFSTTMVMADLPPKPDDFPTREITIIVPTAPGGSFDLLARGVAMVAADLFGVPMVVRNMPGAGTTLGAEALVNSPADGYTLSSSSDTAWVYAPLTTGVDFCSIEDVEYVVAASESASAITMDPRLPFNDFNEIMAYAKENPGELTIATASLTSNMQMALLAEQGYELTVIPFDGGAPAAAAAAGGHTSLYTGTYAATKSLVDAGEAKLVLFRPDAQAEDWMPRVGLYPEFEEIMRPVGTVLTAIQAPKGIPQDRLDYIEAVLLKALQDERFIEYAIRVGFSPIAMGREEYTAIMHERYLTAKDLVERVFGY